ncbi:MAG: acetyltransferase [Desulforudis sp.]|jgi:sugar O-acyltransferase (sialic acid O-acetyltransferase NeuD family)|nr:MAG: acetyltransferase [Desulforudis sp.]
MKNNKVIIVGDSAFAEIAYEYFLHDTDFEVVAFSVENKYLERGSLFGVPIVPFETLERSYDPGQHKVFVAITYIKLNRVRTKLCNEARKKGFELATYVSSKAFVWDNVQIGENCFIFENNVIQPFVKIGNNVIVWSGNHIGHHSIIKDNCFISSHAVISGFVEMGENCFIGVNSTISNNIKIARNCVIGAGALILKDTGADEVYKGLKASAAESSSLELFNVMEDGIVLGEKRPDI